MAKTLTAQVRKILRDTVVAGSHEMWTNKYEKCRTVKCYAPKGDELILDAASEIQDLCKKLGIKFNMRVKKNSGYRGMGRAVIVRLPLHD
jgi:hypothetical protein